MSHEYLQKSKVWAYFREKGVRISGEAKPKIIEILNQGVTIEIDVIIEKLPKFSKGQHKGEPKRKTIKVEDLK